MKEIIEHYYFENSDDAYQAAEELLSEFSGSNPQDQYWHYSQNYIGIYDSCNDIDSARSICKSNSGKRSKGV